MVVLLRLDAHDLNSLFLQLFLYPCIYTIQTIFPTHHCTISYTIPFYIFHKENNMTLAFPACVINFYYPFESPPIFEFSLRHHSHFNIKGLFIAFVTFLFTLIVPSIVGTIRPFIYVTLIFLLIIHSCYLLNNY